MLRDGSKTKIIAGSTKATERTRKRLEKQRNKRRAKSFTKAKTRDLTNHKESSACLLAKLDSARFSLQIQLHLQSCHKVGAIPYQEPKCFLFHLLVQVPDLPKSRHFLLKYQGTSLQIQEGRHPWYIVRSSKVNDFL